jgi:hypothetical protein
MKKHVMSIFAVLLAVAFSAFTPGSKSVNANKDEDPMFWYFFDPGTGYLDGQISDGRILHTVARTATDCSDNPLGTIECARAYDEEQDPYETSPGIGVDRVKEIPE